MRRQVTECPEYHGTGAEQILRFSIHTRDFDWRLAATTLASFKP